MHSAALSHSSRRELLAGRVALAQMKNRMEVKMKMEAMAAEVGVKAAVVETDEMEALRGVSPSWASREYFGRVQDRDCRATGRLVGPGRSHRRSSNVSYGEIAAGRSVSGDFVLRGKRGR